MQIGKYHRIAELARGGMGVVYVAATQGLGGFSKLFVLKEIRQELAMLPEFAAMFLEEARLAARLSHANIVQTHEIGSEGQHLYLVMDYLDGRPLSSIVRKRDPRFTVGQRLRVLCEVLTGLQYAHTATTFDGSPAGVVHRDVTPQNIFLTVDGQVKLMDFGIAKAVDSRLETNAGVLKGKPGYMAPEQIRGNVDPRSDVFAVGVILWELLAEKRMWGKRNDIEILTSLLAGDIPSIDVAAPDAPLALRAIAAKALAPAPADRYQSAEAFEKVLDDYVVASGEVPSLREAGKLVRELFSAERARAHAAIDTVLKRIAGGAEPSSLPRLGESSDSAAISSSMPYGVQDMDSSRETVTAGTKVSVQPTPMPTSTPTSSVLPHVIAVMFGLVAISALALAFRGGGGGSNSTGRPATAFDLDDDKSGIKRVIANQGPSVGPSTVELSTVAPSTPELHAAGPTPIAVSGVPLPARIAAGASASTQVATAGAAAASTPRVNYMVNSRPGVIVLKPVTPDASPGATAKGDCDPPYYYEDTKKVFKVGCL